MKKLSMFSAVVIAAILNGCTPTIKTQNEVTIKPIQVTLDVNLKVDQELAQALSGDVHKIKPDAKSPDVRERRRARHDQINAWKRAQLLGEGNNGLLESRIADDKLSEFVKEVTDAENSDRQIVFKTIAAQQKIPVESVAQRWAKRMADHASKGVFIQDANGKWVEK
ncbi:MAG: YdbL family protein [Victivallales bacterium]|jgi:uncharacterized protein YdbL (DUF1318 family)|nr:YdbL family protein [Victivallales bacterium]